MGNYFGNMMGGFGFGLGWLGTLIIWALIIWVIVLLVRGFSGHGGCCGGQHGAESKKSSPLDILKERYAKGEVSKEDFDRMKKDLE